jgi:hypothetical protein
MRVCLLILCMCAVSVLYGQAELTVDKTHIRIGDQLTATIELISTMGGDWINRENPWPDTMKSIEVVRGPDTVAGRDPLVEVNWTLTFFDSGYIRIPPVPVIISHHGRVDTFFTEAVPITVVTVEPDSTGLIDIKDIDAQGFDPGFYKKYIPHALVILALIGALIYWLRRPKQKVIVTPPAPPPPAPHVWALQQLEQLSAKRLWEQGEVKEHYSTLTSILRSYLERRYNIHALEQTTPEIINQLHSLGVTRAMQDDTAELLNIADLVKFAKAEPGENLHVGAIGRVRDFVNATIPAPVVEDKKRG